jgi:hypothetical protein
VGVCARRRIRAAQNQLDWPVLDPAEALAETHANDAVNHETSHHTS